MVAQACAIRNFAQAAKNSLRAAEYLTDALRRDLAYLGWTPGVAPFGQSR
jgi:hypothetical protein